MSRHALMIAAAATVVASAAGAAAYAQAQPQAKPQPRVEREVRIEKRGDRVVRIERDGDRVMVFRGHDGKDRAEHLKNLLQLRPNQEAALTAYLEAMKPKPMAMRHDADAEARPKTTTEKLARMEQHMAEREAAQRARIDATRRFYNQLDAGQKKAFDELPLMMGPGMPDMPMHAIRVMHRGDGPQVHFPAERFEGEGFRHRMPMPPRPPRAPLPPEPPEPPAPSL